MFVADNAGIYKIEKALALYRANPINSFESLQGITSLTRMANTYVVKLDDCNQSYLELYWQYLNIILKRIETGYYIVKPSDIAECTLLVTVTSAPKFPRSVAEEKYVQYLQERKRILQKIGIPSGQAHDHLVIQHFCNTGDGLKDIVELAQLAVLIQKYNN